jgi:hypothetical protein
MSDKYIANDASKAFMRKVGAIPDKKYPDSGVLEFDDKGNVSWYSKGVKKTLQKSKIPLGVGMAEGEENSVEDNKMSKNSVTESYKVFPNEVEEVEDKSVPAATKLSKRKNQNAFNAAVEGGMKYVRAIANGRDR